MSKHINENWYPNCIGFFCSQFIFYFYFWLFSANLFSVLTVEVSKNQFTECLHLASLQFCLASCQTKLQNGVFFTLTQSLSLNFETHISAVSCVAHFRPSIADSAPNKITCTQLTERITERNTANHSGLM